MSLRPPPSPLFPYTTLFRSLSSQAPITTSSPPCPRRVTKFGPDFSRNAAELGTRSAKNCCARATTSAGDSETVVVWIMESVERSEEHTSELQSHHDLVCRLL